MEEGRQGALRMIPSVNDILEHPEVKCLVEDYGRDAVLHNIRQIINEYRNSTNLDVKYKQGISRQNIEKYIVNRLKEKIAESQKTSLRKVINATGIILHTNLGRAPLPDEALKAVQKVSEGYSNLEYDLEFGSRGSRHSHIELILSRITGAESAMVVNNNAAAVFLCLNTVANGNEVIISRGQQVEIGGSFRIPDIIARSGARMVEVGTTNKTHLKDYQTAINESTALLLKVHTSNFKVIGFVQEVDLEDMVNIAKRNNLLVMEDLGSGSLIDISMFGLPYEPTVQDSIRKGANLVTFSGDKLLGGPQVGIIAGNKELIDEIKSNPLARMVRCDKMTIAALEAVLKLYLHPEGVVQNIPVLRMIARSEEELEKEALVLEKVIVDYANDLCKTEVVNDSDEIGGGSLPGVILKGRSVAVVPLSADINNVQSYMRKFDTPVICRIYKDAILINVRALDKKDYITVAKCLRQALRDA